MRRADLKLMRSSRRLAAARRKTSTVLLTGFLPFGGARVNASEEIVRRLDGRRCAGALIVGLVLPCAFDVAASEMKRALRTLRPSLVVALGEADRDAITPELVAVNLNDARIPDNRGRQPKGAAVIRGAPESYPSRLPVARITGTLRSLGFPARTSSSAGTYVCNHVFFALMHRLGRPRGGHREAGGFIHVPAVRGNARLDLARYARAILCAVRISLLHA